LEAKEGKSIAAIVPTSATGAGRKKNSTRHTIKRRRGPEEKKEGVTPFCPGRKKKPFVAVVAEERFSTTGGGGEGGRRRTYVNGGEGDQDRGPFCLFREKTRVAPALAGIGRYKEGETEGTLWGGVEKKKS